MKINSPLASPQSLEIKSRSRSRSKDSVKSRSHSVHSEKARSRSGSNASVHSEKSRKSKSPSRKGSNSRSPSPGSKSLTGVKKSRSRYLLIVSSKKFECLIFIVLGATQQHQEKPLVPDLEADHENHDQGATRQIPRNPVDLVALLDVLAVDRDLEVAQEAVHVQEVDRGVVVVAHVDLEVDHVVAEVDLIVAVVGLVVADQLRPDDRVQDLVQEVVQLYRNVVDTGVPRAEVVRAAAIHQGMIRLSFSIYISTTHLFV